MSAKPDATNTKTGHLRPVRKVAKGTTETARLFINVDDSIRRTQNLRLTRYVE